MSVEGDQVRTLVGVLRDLPASVRQGRRSVAGAIGLGLVVTVPLVLLTGAVGLAALWAATIGVAAVRGAPLGEAEPDAVAVTLAVLLTLGIGVLVVRAGRRHGRRVAAHRARLARWADRNGWSYEPRASAWTSRWSATALIGRPATDVLTREDERGRVTSFTLGDAMTVDLPGARRQVAVVSGATRYPALSLTRTGPRDRLAVRLGAQDIEVEAHGINERWRAVSTDERFAHAVLHPRLLERLEASVIPGVGLHVEDRDVVLHCPGPIDLAWIRPLSDLALDVAALMPAFLADDHPPLPPEVPRRLRRT